MTTELTGARALAPMFGTSLYVWSAVMAITLCGLAAGYFIGGRISAKTLPEKKLMYVLFLAGIFMMLMPLIGKLSHLFAFHFNLLLAVSASSLLVLFPPLFFMGMVSPLIIHCLINENKGGGKRAGEVYALSTLGGILFTFLTGFWLLPSFGMNIPMVILGGALIVVPLFYLVKFRSIASSIVLLAFAAYSAYAVFKQAVPANYVRYESDGIFGKIEVIDYGRVNEFGLQPRYLLVNNIIQSSVNIKNTGDYIDPIDSLVAREGNGKKALVLGLGGGSIANVFIKKGYEVTAVELDERIYRVAKKYFGLDPSVNVVIDDARHYVNQLKERYDYIVIDVFHGEDPPYYVLTKESIGKMKENITAAGKIIVNTYGYLAGKNGKGNLAILKTFDTCELACEVIPTGPTEEQRNLLICATKKTQENAPPISRNGLDMSNYSLAELPALTDNYCPLDFLNAHAGLHWRQLYIRNFILQRK
jgi:predicted membrane-bound spermidine synthase